MEPVYEFGNPNPIGFIDSNGAWHDAGSKGTPAATAVIEDEGPEVSDQDFEKYRAKLARQAEGGGLLSRLKKR